jgi:hypothetical protein
MVAKSDPNSKLIAENRRARFDYSIESDLEAGIMLFGSEVKSLRQGGSNIAESYASVEGGELWLINGYIAPYLQAKTFGHEERRRRKLLVSKKGTVAPLGRRWPRGHDHRADEDVLQRPRHREAEAWHRQGQEAGRQARDQREARLGPPESAAHEAEQPRLIYRNRTFLAGFVRFWHCDSYRTARSGKAG